VEQRAGPAGAYPQASPQAARRTVGGHDVPGSEAGDLSGGAAQRDLHVRVVLVEGDQFGAERHLGAEFTRSLTEQDLQLVLTERREGAR
jgi:hypothetical protein